MCARKQMETIFKFTELHVACKFTFYSTLLGANSLLVVFTQRYWVYEIMLKVAINK